MRQYFVCIPVGTIHSLRSNTVGVLNSGYPCRLTFADRGCTRALFHLRFLLSWLDLAWTNVLSRLGFIVKGILPARNRMSVHANREQTAETKRTYKDRAKPQQQSDAVLFGVPWRTRRHIRSLVKMDKAYYAAASHLQRTHSTKSQHNLAILSSGSWVVGR